MIKVLKYPTMFMCADAVIISKADIMEHFQFSIERVKADLARLKADMPLFLTSSKDKGSIEVLRDFIVQKRAQNYQSQHQF